MTDIVERIARIIAEIDGMPDEWQYYKPEAFAALKAIQETHAIVPLEPTEAMLEAGCDTGPVGCCNMSTGDAYKVHTAMIQAAPKVGE